MQQCGIRLASGKPCPRPVSPQSVLGSCERHRLLHIHRAWAEGWPSRLPIRVTAGQEVES